MVVRRMNGSLHVSKDFEGPTWKLKNNFDRENCKVVSAMNNTGAGRPWDTLGESIRAWGKVKGVFLCFSRYRLWVAVRNIQG